jgi:hypothetical protein
MDDDRDFLFIPPFFRHANGDAKQIILFVVNSAAHPKDNPFSGMLKWYGTRQTVQACCSRLT